MIDMFVIRLTGSIKLKVI